MSSDDRLEVLFQGCFIERSTVLLSLFEYTVKSVYSGHCVRQSPLYYSQLVQAPIGKTPYVKHLFKAATSLLQPFISGPWVTVINRFHCSAKSNTIQEINILGLFIMYLNVVTDNLYQKSHKNNS